MILIPDLLQFCHLDNSIMLNEFRRYIEENNLAKKSDRILAAVSGGIDSMVMADLLMKAGLLCRNSTL